MKIERNTVTLSTGTTFFATDLTPLRKAEVDAYGAADDPAWILDSYSVDETEKLTPAERREIAEYMAARWMAWGEKDPT